MTKADAKPGWPLRWESEYDENDNDVLEAVGGSSDGESGDLCYRIRQEVRNNRHVWVEASDPEMMMDEEGPLRWNTAREAKQAMQRHHDKLTQDATASANRKTEP